MVTNKVQVTIDNKWILANSKGEGQVHAYFDNEYHGNGENRYGKNYYCHKVGIHERAYFDWHIYIRSWFILKVNANVSHIFISIFLKWWHIG